MGTVFNKIRLILKQLIKNVVLNCILLKHILVSYENKCTVKAILNRLTTY